jgi:hypothetical protein
MSIRFFRALAEASDGQRQALSAGSRARAPRVLAACPVTCHGYAACRPGAPFHLPDGGPPLWPLSGEPGPPTRYRRPHYPGPARRRAREREADVITPQDRRYRPTAAAILLRPGLAAVSRPGQMIDPCGTWGSWARGGRNHRPGRSLRRVRSYWRNHGSRDPRVPPRRRMRETNGRARPPSTGRITDHAACPGRQPSGLSAASGAGTSAEGPAVTSGTHSAGRTGRPAARSVFR